MKSSLVAVAASFAFSCTVNVTPKEKEPDNMQKEEAPSDDTAKPADTASPTPTGSATASVPQKICTEMGCESGVKIDVTGGKGGFAKGAHTIEVIADGKKGKCELSLPLPACDKGKAAKCSGDYAFDVNEAGCALSAKDQGFGPILLKDAPAEVEVVVKKGNKRIGGAKLKPTYKTIQPNGPDCTPTCKQGTASITLE